MSDVYDIWLYPLQDWWRTVKEMSDFMSTRQMGNFIFRPVLLYGGSVYSWLPPMMLFERVRNNSMVKIPGSSWDSNQRSSEYVFPTFLDKGEGQAYSDMLACNIPIWGHTIIGLLTHT